jgi:transcriptional regulator with XRE-family HTH domain
VFTNAARAVRVLRVRKGWSQAVLAGRAAVSRQMISRLERRQESGMTLRSLDRVVSALGATVHLQVRWQGDRLDQLLDARHASIQQATAELLSRFGWTVRVEVSFNHYGDRGRIDVFACHPRIRVVLVVEAKSGLGDLQETLGRLDVKVRVARQLARELGWTDVSGVVPALVIGDSRAARRVVAQHGALLARLSARGRSAVVWLRRPADPMPDGLLWFVNPPDSHQVSTRRRGGASKRPSAQVV